MSTKGSPSRTNVPGADSLASPRLRQRRNSQGDGGAVRRKTLTQSTQWMRSGRGRNSARQRAVLLSRPKRNVARDARELPRRPLRIPRVLCVKSFLSHCLTISLWNFFREAVRRTRTNFPLLFPVIGLAPGGRLAGKPHGMRSRCTRVGGTILSHPDPDPDTRGVLG